MMNDDTTAGASSTVETSPTCELTGCGVKVGKGGLCTGGRPVIGDFYFPSRIAGSQLTGCRSVNYCSREHQRRDWPSHKLKCRPVEKCEALRNPVKAERKADEREGTEQKLHRNGRERRFDCCVVL